MHGRHGFEGTQADAQRGRKLQRETFPRRRTRRLEQEVGGSGGDSHVGGTGKIPKPLLLVSSLGQACGQLLLSCASEVCSEFKYNCTRNRFRVLPCALISQYGVTAVYYTRSHNERETRVQGLANCGEESSKAVNSVLSSTDHSCANLGSIAGEQCPGTRRNASVPLGTRALKNKRERGHKLGILPGQRRREETGIAT